MQWGGYARDEDDMNMEQQKFNWLLDAALFGGFLVAMWLDLTGVAVHQWWGLGMAALAVYHLMRHRTWAATVTRRLLRGASGRIWRIYAVDAGLLIGFAGITLTGIMISTWLDLSLSAYGLWRTVHVTVSVVTGMLIVLKVGIHYRWIVTIARRAVAPATRPAVSDLAPVPVGVERRDFVRLMGIVGASTLLVGVHALGEDHVERSAAAEASSFAPVEVTTAAALATAGSSCTIRCRRACSYPGHCRRYVDSSDNGKCDLGECSS